MNGLLRSLSSSFASSTRLAARSFSDAAAGAPLGAAAAVSKAAETQGAKSKLFDILSAAPEPLTAAQVWEAAQPLGLRSKRFTKQMLQQLREGGWVKTQPLGAGPKKHGHKSFGYRLNPAKQRQGAGRA